MPSYCLRDHLTVRAALGAGSSHAPGITVLVPALVLLLLSSLPALCAAGPVKVGVSLGLSGEYSVMARDQERAFRLWEREINKKGGLLGRRVELTIVDDLSDAREAVRIYKEFILQEQMDLLFAPFSSKITAAVHPLCEEYRYPILASGAASDELWDQGYRYLFGIFTPAENIASYFLEMLARYQLDDLVLFYSDDPFSRSAARGIRKWAGWLKLNLKLDYQYSKKDPDYIKMVRQARRANGRVVLLSGHFNNAVALRRAMEQEGWRPEVYYANQGPANSAFKEVLGPQAEGVFGTEQWQYLGGISNRVLEKFLRDYQEVYGVEAGYFSVAAYCSARLLSHVVELNKSLDRKELRRTLANLDKPCLTGRFKVDENGRQLRNFTLVTQWQEGALKVVWPPGVKKSEPRWSTPE